MSTYEHKKEGDNASLLTNIFHLLFPDTECSWKESVGIHSYKGKSGFRRGVKYTSEPVFSPEEGKSFIYAISNVTETEGNTASGNTFFFGKMDPHLKHLTVDAIITVDGLNVEKDTSLETISNCINECFQRKMNKRAVKKSRPVKPRRKHYQAKKRPRSVDDDEEDEEELPMKKCENVPPPVSHEETNHSDQVVVVSGNDVVTVCVDKSLTTNNVVNDMPLDQTGLGDTFTDNETLNVPEWRTTLSDQQIENVDTSGDYSSLTNYSSLLDSTFGKTSGDCSSLTNYSSLLDNGYVLPFPEDSDDFDPMVFL